MEEKILMNIAQKISKEIGIQLGDKQKVLVRSRIMKRVRDLKLNSVIDYNTYLNRNYESEYLHLVSILTTHHTFFFREFIHFEHLKESLPQLVKNVKAMGRDSIKIWSAASSLGQEVYSLAIFLKVHLKSIDSTINFEIIGSDVDGKSVEHSRKGIYKWDEVKSIPSLYLHGHFSRGTGNIKDYVKVKNDIKDRCNFKTVNLINMGSSMAGEKFDFIFCRNVFIYFNTEQISDISKALSNHLYPHGQLAVGLSETLMHCEVKLHHLGKAIYSLNTVENDIASKKTPHANINPSQASSIVLDKPVTIKPKRSIRVLCVDDSPTVLTILKKILSKDDGFEIVGTAKSGVEAAKMTENLAFDIMTLDIHMPEMNGLEYLNKHYTPKHPPVVIISSVSRENADLAFGCLKAGASDYIEKPTLSGIDEKTEEIQMKLRAALSSSSVQPNNITDSLDKSFTLPPIIRESNQKLRLITASISDLPKIKVLLGSLKAPQPPTFIVVENLGTLDHSLIQDLSQQVSLPVKSFNETVPVESNRIYVCCEEKVTNIPIKNLLCPPVILALSGTGMITINAIKKIPNVFIVAEEVSQNTSPGFNELTKMAKYKIPYTSLSYESEKILSEFEIRKAA